MEKRSPHNNFIDLCQKDTTQKDNAHRRNPSLDSAMCLQNKMRSLTFGHLLQSLIHNEEQFIEVT
jgi:hypothetical protein